MTLALLGGSALLLRSLWNVVSVPLGFNAERVVTLDAGLGHVRYPTVEQGAAFFEELLARARAMPGVVAAAMSDTAPPPRRPGRGSRGGKSKAGRSTPTRRRLDPRSIGDAALLRHVPNPGGPGRTFQEADWAGEPAVALNESAERVLFAGERAIGRRLRLLRFQAVGRKLVERPWYTVVGVTADVRNGRRSPTSRAPSSTSGAAGTVERGRWPRSRRHGAICHFARRPSCGCRRVPQADRRRPRSEAARDHPDRRRAAHALTAQPRFIAWLLTAFAALALLLAAAGLYSVASYLVLQRRRDIGVRIAIGASPRDVARQVVGEAGRWIVGGALVGSALGWMGTRALQSQLYQVEALDPWSWTGALLALALVLVMAVFRPAYRAAHVDPVTALRAD